MFDTPPARLTGMPLDTLLWHETSIPELIKDGMDTLFRDGTRPSHLKIPISFVEGDIGIAVTGAPTWHTLCHDCGSAHEVGFDDHRSAHWVAIGALSFYIGTDFLPVEIDSPQPFTELCEGSPDTFWDLYLLPCGAMGLAPLPGPGNGNVAGPLLLLPGNLDALADLVAVDLKHLESLARFAPAIADILGADSGYSGIDFRAHPGMLSREDADTAKHVMTSAIAKAGLNHETSEASAGLRLH